MHPYGGPGDPHYPPRGLSRYQFMGSDLSSDPRMGMDPRSRTLASNRDPNYSSYGRRPRTEDEIIENPRSPLAGARDIDEMLRRADQGQVPQRDMYIGSQPQPIPMPQDQPMTPARPGGPTGSYPSQPSRGNLLDLLRKLGVI